MITELRTPFSFQALDFVISEARKHKIRLILPLCNNWKDYGGKAQYVRWGKEAGLNLLLTTTSSLIPQLRVTTKLLLR